MTHLALALTALGVSADAFAVALGKGLGLRHLRLHQALAVGLTFGLFQALMPLIGFALGSGVSTWVTGLDHWIAFALLAVVGGQMVRGALQPDDGEELERSDRLDVRELLVLGVATSIDALAVGLSLALVEVDIVPTVTAIGLTTFALSTIGVYLGHSVGRRWARPAGLAGGLILIGIGVSILVEHLS